MGICHRPTALSVENHTYPNCEFCLNFPTCASDCINESRCCGILRRSGARRRGFTAEISCADAGAEVAEGQVSRLCVEAQECMIQNRRFDLASLMLTSANVVSQKLLRKIEENEVESWVVNAITAKLIDCRIDQMNRAVIASFSERVFGHHQWEALGISSFIFCTRPIYSSKHDEYMKIAPGRCRV